MGQNMLKTGLRAGEVGAAVIRAEPGGKAWFANAFTTIHLQRSGRGAKAKAAWGMGTP
jgi:hypothetical protein